MLQIRSLMNILFLIICFFQVSFAKDILAEPQLALWPSSTALSVLSPNSAEQSFIVPVLQAGKVNIPFESSIFKSSGEDVLKGRKGEVYASLDCLHWVESPPNGADPFLKHPALAERDYFGTFGRANQGKYASPFNPQVREELERLVAKIAKYPQVKGIVLRCELPLGAPILGYSEAARADSLAALDIDPAQVILSVPSQPYVSQAEDWIMWRRFRVSQLVDKLAQTFKKENPKGRVIVVGNARWGQLKLGKQNTTLADWPAWSLSPAVNEVMLEDQWRASAPDAIKEATTLLARPDETTISILVSPDQFRDEATRRATAQSLAADLPKPLVMRVEQESDVEAAKLLRQQIESFRATPPQIKEKLTITAEGAPPIRIGESAPDFTVLDFNGRTWHLNDWRSKKNILLTFFPRCFTGGCEQQLESLRVVHEELAGADVEIVAVSVDTAPVQRAFANSLGFNFTFLPDTERLISQLYGAAQNTEQLSDRMSVFIDKQGIVRLIDKQVVVGTHGSDVLKQMETLGKDKG